MRELINVVAKKLGYEFYVTKNRNILCEYDEKRLKIRFSVTDGKFHGMFTRDMQIIRENIVLTDYTQVKYLIPILAEIKKEYS